MRRDNSVGVVLNLLLDVVKIKHRLLLRSGSRRNNLLVYFVRYVLLV